MYYLWALIIDCINPTTFSGIYKTEFSLRNILVKLNKCFIRNALLNGGLFSTDVVDSIVEILTSIKKKVRYNLFFLK